jgi:UDP-GlcNAc:undecaprenyl-phosphate/decaprenyl-phosphate GlcNAc-1-phosphate transferase
MTDATLQYIPTMVLGFAVALGLTPISRQIAMRLGVVDKPNHRKIHQDQKPMMGGLAILVAIAASLLLFSPVVYLRELAAILLGAGLLAVVGLLDDRFTLGVRPRFLLMGLAALIVVLAGVQIRLFGTPWIDVPLTLIWVLALTNALNFLDNMDGLTSGISAIASGFFLLIALGNGQILVSLLAAAVFGASIGFLAYNFNPASTFMGDMGALVLGYLLAVMAIKLNFAGQPLGVTWMIPILVLALPVFDINLVVWTRLAEGRSPTEAGKDHTSHRLLALGFSQRQTLGLLYGFCLVFGALGTLVSQAPPATGWLVGVIGLVLLGAMALFMVWIRQRIQKPQGRAARSQ